MPKEFNWMTPDNGRPKSPVCVCAYISSKGIPADQFYVNGTSGAWRHEPYMDTGEVRSQKKTRPQLWLHSDSARGPW